MFGVSHETGAIPEIGVTHETSMTPETIEIPLILEYGIFLDGVDSTNRAGRKTP